MPAYHPFRLCRTLSACSFCIQVPAHSLLYGLCDGHTAAPRFADIYTAFCRCGWTPFTDVARLKHAPTLLPLDNATLLLTYVATLNTTVKFVRPPRYHHCAFVAHVRYGVCCTFPSPCTPCPRLHTHVTPLPLPSPHTPPTPPPHTTLRTVCRFDCLPLYVTHCIAVTLYHHPLPYLHLLPRTIDHCLLPT